MRRLLMLTVAACCLLAPVAHEAQAPAGISTLRIAYSEFEEPGLDPHRNTDPLSFRLIATAYETLYIWSPGPTPRVVPCLAKDFPAVSPDGLTVTIKVNTAAKFHPDGCFGEARTRGVKASDFVASFKRLSAWHHNNLFWMAGGLVEGLDEYGQRAARRGQFGLSDSGVAGLTAPDDETLVIKLTRPYGPLTTLLAHPAFSCVPAEAIALYGRLLDDRAIGTGPYRLNAIADGKLYIFKRWADYRGAKGGYERVVFSQRDEFRMRGDILSGRFHEVPCSPVLHRVAVPDGQIAQRFVQAGVEVIDEQGYGFLFMAFNMEDPIWGLQDDDGRALRRAVSLCLDRKLLALEMGDLAPWKVPQEHVFPRGMEFEETGHGHDFGAYDATEAKRILEASKFKGGIDPDSGRQLVLRMLTTQSSWYEAIHRTLRECLRPLGISLEARYVDDYREVARTSDHHLFHAGWFLDYPDAINYLQLFRGANSGVSHEFANYCRYRDPEFDALFNQLERLAPIDANRNVRRALTAAMARLMVRDQPIIPLLSERQLHLRSNKVAWAGMAPQTFNDIRYLRPVDAELPAEEAK